MFIRNNYYFAKLLPLIFLLSVISQPVKSSSALAAWSLNSNGILELRTKKLQGENSYRIEKIN